MEARRLRDCIMFKHKKSVRPSNINNIIIIMEIGNGRNFTKTAARKNLFQ
jgi:hypothetical protein